MANNKPVKVKKNSQFQGVIKRLRKNKMAMAGLFMILFLIVLAIIAPLIAPYGPREFDLLRKLEGPSWDHIFGTDDLGRDIFSRILYGAKYSLSLSVLSVTLGTLVGIILGAIAGYFGGITDNIIMRLMDVLQAIPSMLLCIAISAALGSGFVNTIIAMSIGHISMITRMLRGSILSVREQEFIEAENSINCSRFRIIVMHVLPNSISPIIISVTMGMGSAILTAAGLSYLGLGVQAPTPEWGAMLSAGRNYIYDHPHVLIFPGIFIMITVLAFNMLGDGLRDAMDPKLKD